MAEATENAPSEESDDDDDAIAAIRRRRDKYQDEYRYDKTATDLLTTMRAASQEYVHLPGVDYEVATTPTTRWH
jgi:hypothetical protein